MAKESLVTDNNGVDAVRAELWTALKGVREELDVHLDTINQATEEVQSNYEYLSRLDVRIERLGERIEQIALVLRSSGIAVADPVPVPVSFELSEQEKGVFLVLYTSDTRMLTYADIALAVRDSEFIVQNMVTSLIQKGVPVKKRYVGNTAYLGLDSRFRETQAKTNLLNISQKTVREFC